MGQRLTCSITKMEHIRPLLLIKINIFSRFFHFFSFNNVLVWTSKTPYKGSLCKMSRMEFGAWIKFFWSTMKRPTCLTIMSYPLQSCIYWGCHVLVYQRCIKSWCGVGKHCNRIWNRKQKDLLKLWKERFFIFLWLGFYLVLLSP